MVTVCHCPGCAVPVTRNRGREYRTPYLLFDTLTPLVNRSTAYKTDSIEKNKWRIENREQRREQRKKERTKTELEIIKNPEADNNALHYLQLDEEIKKLESKKSEIRETLLGITGVTHTGVEIKWSTIQSNTVDKDAVEKALGYVPMKQGKESARLSIKQTGGK